MCRERHFTWQVYNLTRTARYLHCTMGIATVTVDILLIPRKIPNETNQIIRLLQFTCAKALHRPSLRLDPYRTYPHIDTQGKSVIAAH